MYSAANGLLLVVSVGPISRRGGAYCIMKCGIFGQYLAYSRRGGAYCKLIYG